MELSKKKELSELEDVISSAVLSDEMFAHAGEKELPHKTTVIEIVDDLKKLIFPGFFGNHYNMMDIYMRLKDEIALSLAYFGNTECAKKAEEMTMEFLNGLPEIQKTLFKDVDAFYEGDPAAHSKEVIIITYPGFQAIFVYRIAHKLFEMNVPLIPRIMSEHVHSLTGIDINPGATIGEYFFMDHGTGIVIGETCVIGNHVKLYQGVTLGALSLKEGRKLADKKRHPTIEDGVTIYSGASILGGDTIIGHDTIVGGNVFITSSIRPNSTVRLKDPELLIHNKKEGSL